MHPDAKYTKELADAKAENDALGASLIMVVGCSVKGKCPVPSSAEISSASGMGNDATVEIPFQLLDETFGIRRNYPRPNSTGERFRNNIRTQCLR